MPSRRLPFSTNPKFPRRKVEKRIHVPAIIKRPLRFQIRTIIRHVLIRGDTWWFTMHRRGPGGTPSVGADPLEARAIPHNMLRGTLPERILYKSLVSDYHFVPEVDFDFQSLSSHSKILTADLKWIEAGKLREGDKLFSFTDEPIRRGRRRWRMGTVIHNHEEMTDAYKIIFSDGREMIATAEHPWIVYGDRRTDHLIKGGTQVWARTDELYPGVEVPVFFDTWKEDLSKEAGWLSGIFDGEGSLCQVQSVRGDNTHYCNLTVAQKTGPTLSKIRRILNDKGFSFNDHDHRKYKKSYNNTFRDLSELRISGGRPEMLRFLGVIRPERLIDKLDIDILGDMRPIDKITVVSVEPAGKQLISHIGVDCKTYISEGLGSHNSSLQGGRLETGGIVADFLFKYLRIVLNPLGPTHYEFIRIAKDHEQIQALEELGYQVYMIPEGDVYNEETLNELLRHIFNIYHGGGGEVAPNFDLIQNDGFSIDEMYRSVLELRNLI